MGALLNWIDTMFFGIRRIFSPADDEIPERPAVKFAGACSVVDDPTGNRTVVTVGGLLPNASGGFTIGTAAGGWVTVRSDGHGFQVLDAGGNGVAFAVDNKSNVISIGYRVQLDASLQIADSIGKVPLASGIALQSING